MKFTHLHVHSHYSLLDGLGKIDGLIDLTLAQNMDSLAITDHGALYGAIEFYKKAKAKKLKPIIGCEMYVAPGGMLNKRPKIDDKRHHLVVLAKDKTGYENLVEMTTKAWLEGFYYKPRIDRDLLREKSQGLVGLSACLAGEIPTAIYNGDLKKAEALALEYQEIFGKDNFFLEIEHHPGIKEQEPTNQEIIKIGRKLKIPIVATNDVHYLRPEDSEAQDVLMAVNTGVQLDQKERLSMRSDDFSLKSPEQMAEWFKKIPEAIENTQQVASLCNLEFKLGNIQLPHFKVPSGKSPNEFLKELAYRGLSRRYKSTSPDILKRLEYELDVISQTGFASYFLIVQDFVNWSKENGIAVGPGRGSAAGSIIAYLLNITDIDPLKYDLLFERFLNPERISMPDIDLDFADARREEVIEYVRQKYGNDHVAQIITFGTMAARAAIRDSGRAMGYSYNLCDQVAKMIPFVPGQTLERALHETIELHQLYDSDEQVKKLIDTAMKLEGVARHASTHAAGVLISKDSLTRSVPLQHPTQDDNIIVTQYEMHAIEDLGLLKMDFLGLKTLTQIENTLEIVKKTKQKNIDITSLPLDDKDVFKLLQEGRTTGVFQLESGGMKRTLRDLGPTELEDIIAIVALYRPGPMDFIPEFIARKHGLKKIEYLHPKLETILKKTYGVCVYQEQLMQIARELAGFSLAEADTLRKAVGKKIKKLLDEQRGKMIQGMERNGIETKTAEEIWQWAEPFARYGFNKSHAACYATLGYQTAYLKTHFPTEFMVAIMNSEQNDIERIAFLVNECSQMKIDVLPPDINESLENFTVVKDGVIRFGLAAVKNVGRNVVEAIVKERKASGHYKSISDFVERVRDKDLNKKSLESLTKCGAMDKLGERGQLLFNMEYILGFSREIQKSKNNGQVGLFDVLKTNGDLQSSGLPQLKLQDTPPAIKRERLTWEKELLGLYISDHPVKEYESYIEKNALLCSKISPQMLGKNVKVGGVISKIHKIITKTGRPMLFVTIEDTKAKIEVLVFPKTLEQTATLWQEDKPIIVSGRLDDKDGNLKILCEEVRELNGNHLNHLNNFR
ncbi:MAG: DNA polymerase III subunit alpha [Candidatus Portnoybacteria bacterium]|nr:DNA polymerase III subunit alpha [Candidatus Portnoybacteria bacterium]